MAEPVLVRERHGAVLVLRLNRPEARNALNMALMSELGLGFASAEDDPQVRVVVLTGTGDRVFSSGMDLHEFASGKTPEAVDAGGMAVFGRFLGGQLSIPVVGAANGSALAGGFELLLACDLVVASDAASFGLPEVKRALYPAGGGAFVSQRIPLAVALELTLTGDPIDAPRALAVGLVNRVVPADDVMGAAIELAARVGSNGPLAVRAIKEIVRLAATDPERATERNEEWRRLVFASQDAKEGATAFLEKREPVWVGR